MLGLLGREETLHPKSRKCRPNGFTKPIVNEVIISKTHRRVTRFINEILF